MLSKVIENEHFLWDKTQMDKNKSMKYECVSISKYTLVLIILKHHRYIKVGV